ncbi:multi-sensor signal transduction histidine kinase [Oscillochloris trichoides DG-6]|uniref:histidine kinase n=1 Tax=Oscillochloris trichoides DG-6 TaxID=765420 RepID=E1IDR1_9CHLR|nr:sensor histidine kinase [Oscillochloris trichoides]EFO80689.1 multi-sensor signal transduction histidine kinase [Oscillochloris trichoides DG-6]
MPAPSEMSSSAAARIAELEARVAALEKSEAELRIIAESSQLFVVTTPDADRLLLSLMRSGATTIGDVRFQLGDRFQIHILAVNNNIMALKQAEREIHNRDELLHMAYDAAQLGTWQRDLTGRPDRLQLDARARIHYGVEVEDAPFGLILEHIHPDDRALWWESVAITTEPSSERRYSTEYRVIHPDGSIHWLAIHARTYFTGEGAERRAVLSNGTSQDITERKQEEAALRASADQLQNLSRRLVEAHERERRHIARELHDEIGQVLTGLKLSLGASAAAAPPPMLAVLNEAKSSLNELMARVRDLSLDLRPALLDDLGLLPALGWYLDRYTPRTGVQVELRHQGVSRRFSPEVETVAYRTIQEALTNVARHAHTNHATVWLLADAQRLMLRIDDAGCGFDSDVAMRTLRTQTTGGLSGMQERMQLIGGLLTIESAQGVGTRIIAELPLWSEESLNDNNRAGG